MQSEANESHTGRPGGQGEDDIDLIKVVGTLWRGAGWIAGAALLMGLVGFIVVKFYLTPLYTAQAKVAFDDRQQTLINLESVMSGISGDQVSINTEVEILRSRELMGKLVDRLDLANEPLINPYFESGSAVEPSKLRETLINQTLRKLSVSNVRSSYVFTIYAVTPDPTLSQRLANGLAEAYIENQLDVKFEATARASAWLSDRVVTLREELETSQDAVKQFTSQKGIITEAEVEAANRQVTDTRSRLEDAQARLAQAQGQVSTLTAARDSGDTEAIITALEADDLAARAPSEARTASALTRLNARLDRAELDAQRALAQIGSLQGSLGGLEERYDNLSQDLVTLEQLTREAEASRALYEYFLTRLKETSVQEGIQQADSRVLSYAPLPTIPSSPRKKRTIATYILIGLILGAGGVLLREFLRNGYRTAAELEQRFGVPVLGQLPLIPGGERADVLKYLMDKPTSAAAESVRNLRTSVLLANIDNPPEVIMFTSCNPSEGKTTNALALAQNFAGMNKKVLLIEGDTRRPMFKEYFSEAQAAGSMLHVLTGEATLASEVRALQGIGIDFLGGGRIRANAADVFASDSFGALIAEARAAYDIVIIDTPPVLLVPDARVIATHVDLVLFAVQWDETSEAQIREALRLFDIAGQSVSGFVLSQIDPKRMGKYGYSGRYGAYGYQQNKYYTS